MRKLLSTEEARIFDAVKKALQLHHKGQRSTKGGRVDKLELAARSITTAVVKLEATTNGDATEAELETAEVLPGTTDQTRTAAQLTA